MREEERQEKEYITVERGLPGFQPRRDYRAKLKSRNGDVCEPAVPRRLAPFPLSSFSLPLAPCLSEASPTNPYERARLSPRFQDRVCWNTGWVFRGGRRFSNGNKEISACRSTVDCIVNMKNFYLSSQEFISSYKF